MEAYRDGRLEQSIDLFRSIHQAYSDRGDRLKTAETANNLCVVFLQAQDPQSALEFVRDTPDTFLELGEERYAAQAYGNLGSALEACKQVDEAEQAYRAAADIFARLNDNDQHAYTLQALSRLQLRQGRHLEALSTMQQGLEATPRPGFRKRLLRRLLSWPFRLLGRSPE